MSSPSGNRHAAPRQRLSRAAVTSSDHLHELAEDATGRAGIEVHELPSLKSAPRHLIPERDARRPEALCLLLKLFYLVGDVEEALAVHVDELLDRTGGD